MIFIFLFHKSVVSKYFDLSKCKRNCNANSHIGSFSSAFGKLAKWKVFIMFDLNDFEISFGNAINIDVKKGC